MTRQKLLATVASSLIAITLAQFSPKTLYAEGGFNQTTQKKEQGKKKKDGTPNSARPVMWQEPNSIERRDLFYGPGGREGAPDPNAKYTYLRDSKGGTQRKIIVKDDLGREWTVKFGLEVRPETTASRIVWAVGYHADQDYFVREVQIEGIKPRTVYDVRFERRDDGFKEQSGWDWKKNPFAGTRELDGLKVLMALLKNWDLKADNNKASYSKSKDHLVYYVSDLGATLGRTGTFLNNFPVLNKVLFLGDLPADNTPFGAKKSKGDPKAFAEEKFISGVHRGQVKFHVERTRCKEIFKGVSVENARWIGGLLGRLTDNQLNDAFRAGGFNEEETAIYRRTFKERIRQLQSLRG